MTNNNTNTIASEIEAIEPLNTVTRDERGRAVHWCLVTLKGDNGTATEIYQCVEGQDWEKHDELWGGTPARVRAEVRFAIVRAEIRAVPGV